MQMVEEGRKMKYEMIISLFYRREPHILGV
jgi:hypothetical protein